MPGDDACPGTDGRLLIWCLLHQTLTIIMTALQARWILLVLLATKMPFGYTLGLRTYARLVHWRSAAKMLHPWLGQSCDIRLDTQTMQANKRRD
jgi:hypothetical protein